MKNLIRGAILKVNFNTGGLFKFGNFILNGMITNSTLNLLRDIWPTTCHARVSAYVLPILTACSVRNNHGGVIKVNRLLLDSNVLQHFNEEVDGQHYRTSRIRNREVRATSNQDNVNQQVIAALRGLLALTHNRNSVYGNRLGRNRFRRRY